ncbi:hypothetical protein BT69DRAFT_1263373 [Atractiella rhizophila]|nr:hypothetical protein BT69DRAFT_1263373 [Atractiella rhizophila]
MLLPLLSLFLPLAWAAQVPFSRPSHVPTHGISSISRVLELGGALAKDTFVYTLSADGEGGYGGEVEIFVGIAEEERERLTWAEAWEGREKERGVRKLAGIREVGFEEESRSYIYAISLPSSSTSTPRHITLSLLHTRPSVPHPPTLPQTADSSQFMLWTGSLNLGLPVHSPPAELSIKVKTPTPRIRQHSVTNDDEKRWTSKLPTGSNTVSFSLRDLDDLPTKQWIGRVHYEASEPVIVFRDLERIVQVSHWGNSLGVSEAMTLVNAGPKLEGHFSRLAHQSALFLKRTTSLSHVLTSLSFVLPPSIKNPYYIDTVGNVSTSNFVPSIKPAINFPSMKDNKGYSRLDIFPRYPVLGGWNYSFEIGYDATSRSTPHSPLKVSRRMRSAAPT